MNERKLATVYIKIQDFSEPFSPDEALSKGTAWHDLYEPTREAE